MAMKYQKHTVVSYSFTGRDFAWACYQANMDTGYKMAKMTGGRISHGKYKRWKLLGDERTKPIDEFTMNLILEVLEQSSIHSKPQETSNK